MEDRIPSSILTDNFQDGDDWNAATLNKILDIIIKAINNNYNDIVSKTTTPRTHWT